MIGDLVWQREAVMEREERAWLLRKLVDSDARGVREFAGTADAGSRRGSYHYAPRSYSSGHTTYYRRGHYAPRPRGYYSYARPHYGHRTVYLGFFGIPIIVH